MDDCATTTDTDLYGTGIRIGMYLQWLAGFILRNSSNFEICPQVRTASNILASAVALATVINVVQGTALSVDYLLSYYLTVVLFYAESYNLEMRDDPQEALDAGTGEGDIRTLELHADLSLVFQNVYFSAFTLFGAWYWLRGMEGLEDPVCGAKAAMLGVFELRSEAWTRAAAGLAVVCGFAFLVVFLVHLTSLSEGIASGPRLVSIYYAGAMALASSRVGSAYWQKTLLKRLLKPSFPRLASSERAPRLLRLAVDVVHYFLIHLAGPLIAIVSAERMVAANHLVTLTAFGSTGQIIPLFTGFASCLLACWTVAKRLWMERTGRDLSQGVLDAPSGPTAALVAMNPSDR
jgi:hypothetical protein